jgi:integrase
MINVRTYYNGHDITLPKAFRISARSDRKAVLYNDLPTIKEIQQVLKYADSIFRSIILIGLSSGMSKTELCSLTFKDLFDAFSLDPYP